MQNETKDKIYAGLAILSILALLIALPLIDYYHDKKVRDETFDHFNKVVTDTFKQQNDEIDKVIATTNKLRNDCMDLQAATLTWHKMTITHNRTGDTTTILVQMALYHSVTVTGKVFTTYFDSAPFHKKEKK